MLNYILLQFDIEMIKIKLASLKMLWYNPCVAREISW